MNKKIVSFILAMVTIVTVIYACTVSISADSSWKDWRQGDSRWGSIYLGNSIYNMAGYGCYVTSVAKIIKQSGLVDDSFTPGTLINWLNSTNTTANPSFTPDGGLYHAKSAQMVDGLKYENLLRYDDGVTVNSIIPQILDWVKQEKHVIVNVGGHYVPIDNELTYTTGEVYIMDTKPYIQSYDVKLADSYNYIYQVILHSGWAEGYPKYSGYLKECTFYPTAAKVKITEECSPYTLPCNNDTASEYNATSVKLEDIKYKKGDYVTVNGIWYNTKNHYWYQITLADGTTVYLYSTHTDTSATRKVLPEIIDGSFPSNITGITELLGTLTGNGAKITKVQAKVFYGNEPYVGDLVENMYPEDWVECFDYPLKLSKIDLGLQFQNLSVGTYTLVYEVTTSYYTLNSNGISGPFEDLTRITPYFTFTVGSTHEHSYGVWQNYDDNQHKRTCSCGSVEYQNHTWDAGFVNQEPTCTFYGIKTYTCTVCNNKKTEAVPLTAHKLSHEVVESSCQNPEYVKFFCLNCDYISYSFSELIMSNWSATKPTDVADWLVQNRTEYSYRTKDYMTSYKDQLDGWTLYATETQTVNGTWSEWSDTPVNASDSINVETRTLYGYFYYKCSSCGGHSPRYDTCIYCGNTNFSDGWTSFMVSDTADTLTWYSYAGYSYADLYGERVFKWVQNGQQRTQTQYRFAGVEELTIYYYYQWLDWSEWSEVAVFEEDGLEVKTRTVYRYVTSGWADHTWGLIWQNSPSCTQSGEKAFQCSVCSTTRTESIPPTGNHIAGSWTTTKAATCTETGTKVQQCTSCGARVRIETIPVLAHSWNSGVVTTQPTCTKEGVKTYTCSTCNTTKTESVPATGNHIAGSWTTTKAATCTETGTKVQKCTSCGTTVNTETIAVLGHSWNSGSITTPPTATADGVMTYTCTVCSANKTENIPSMGENAPAIVIESATARAGKSVTVKVTLKNNPGVAYLALSLHYDTDVFTLVDVKNGDLLADMDQGLNLLWCDDADASVDGVLCTLTFDIAEDTHAGVYEISAKCREAYNYNDEYVIFVTENASVTVIDCVYGDANGDGNVNGRDVLLLRKYMANYNYDTGVSSVEVFAGADANGDGTVNGRDVLLMRKYMANYDYDTGSSSVVLGPK